MNREQRRKLLKLRRKMNKAEVAEESDFDKAFEWTACSGPSRYDLEKEVEPEIPGVTVPPVDDEFTAKVNRNSWHNKSEFMAFVETINKLATDYDTLIGPLVRHVDELPEEEKEPKWSWAYNHNCKYINLRIDMRDGAFTMTNNEGERINLKQLKWQYKSAKKAT